MSASNDRLATTLLKPLTAATVIVLVVEFPAVTPTAVGDALIEKSGAAAIVSVNISLLRSAYACCSMYA